MPRSPIFMGSGSESERAMRIGLLRMGIGGLLFFTPGLARRLFGIPAEQDNAAVRVISRLFGIRNMVLGAWATQVSEQDPEARRLLYRMNAVVDGVDVAVLLVAGILNEGLRQAAVMGGPLGTTALLSWLDLVADVDSGSGGESVALG